MLLLTPLRRAARALASLFFLALLVPLVACQDNLRGDVVLCEGAVAHIEDCCGAPSNIDCTYTYRAGALFCMQSGCGPSERFPDLDETESETVLNASCSSLRASSCPSYGAGS